MPQSGPAAAEVEELLAGLTPEVRALTLSVRKLVRSVLPRCQEIPDKGARVIGYGYGPGYRDMIATLILSRGGVKLGPARVRRTDAGDPDKCPVWQFHQIYSNDEVKGWVQKGCRSAGIGCIECKQPVIDGVLAEQKPMHERAKMYEEDPQLVRNIIADGCEKARKLAQETMRDVREAIGLDYP